MKASPHTLGLWYTSVSAVLSRVAIISGPGAFCAAAYKPTPHQNRSRAILKYALRWCASHVRTDRPHPAPDGAGLARVALRPPVASLPSRGFPPHALVRGAFVLPATHDGGFASRAPPKALPWELTKGRSCPWTLTRAIAPLTTRRRFSHPGTHDQSLRALDDAQGAFMPLHPDGGYSSPSTRRRTKPAERRCA